MHAELASALAGGNAAAVHDACARRLQQVPGDPDAHRLIAQAFAAQNEPAPALRHARRACELAPDDPRSWVELGRLYALAREFDDAARSFAEAIRIDRDCDDAWHNLGTALKRLGDRQGAFDALKHALMLDPTRADSYFNLGNLLIDADQFDDAVECFERASAHDPSLAQARSRLAQELSQRGKVRRAESLFRQAVGLNPDHIQGWFGLGRTLEDLGEAEGALACYLKVLERRPGHAQAIGQYLALVRDDADARVLAGADAAMASADASSESRALIGYGLAKYHDRRKDYAAAARAGLAANAARRTTAGALDRAALIRRIDAMIETYDADFFARRRQFGLGTDQPVFIVGLPRSGTTLAEQILAAHPTMHGAGELPQLARLAVRSAGELEPWCGALQLDETRSRSAAQTYLQSLRDGAPGDSRRISDKAPLNFFHLAFVALLFPAARIIHCHREARDNALSIWMENFSPDQHYATDFDDLAFFHAQYQRLMAHWQQVLPVKMLDMRYEDTVEDLESQARRLVGFLGVPWDERCLSFHTSERAVQTPSRWQVRRPIYSDSRQRWRRYGESLPQLAQAFPI